MSSDGQPKTAFVFAGGGSFGAIQVGMLHALAAHGIVADMAFGSSVGAVNAAYYAGDAYYRDEPSFTSNYTHTAVPNSMFGDCVDPNNDSHVAARSYHPGGINAVFCDGSVRFFKDSINPTTWFSLGTRAAGDIVSADAY